MRFARKIMTCWTIMVSLHFTELGINAIDRLLLSFILNDGGVTSFLFPGKSFLGLNVPRHVATKELGHMPITEANGIFETTKPKSDLPNCFKMRSSSLSPSFKKSPSHSTKLRQPFINPASTMEKRHGSAFNAIIKHKKSQFPDLSSNNISSIKCTTLCYEILVNSLLKIFHHPSVSLLALKDRMHFAITQWPFIWILYLGRKSALDETKIILEKLIDPPSLPNLPPTSLASLLGLVDSLRKLSLDQAEYGLIETILITKLGRKGKGQKFFSDKFSLACI